MWALRVSFGSASEGLALYLTRGGPVKVLLREHLPAVKLVIGHPVCMHVPCVVWLSDMPRAQRPSLGTMMLQLPPYDRSTPAMHGRFFTGGWLDHRGVGPLSVSAVPSGHMFTRSLFISTNSSERILFTTFGGTVTAGLYGPCQWPSTGVGCCASSAWYTAALASTSSPELCPPWG